MRWFSDISGFIGTGRRLAATLPVGVHKITLNATDSFGLSTEAATEIVVKPKVSILSPIEGNISGEEDVVPFDALALGAEDGTFSWTSTINGTLSDERSFTQKRLKPGTHTVTFTATKNGTSASASVNIIVVAKGLEFLSRFADGTTSKNLTLEAGVKQTFKTMEARGSWGPL